MSFKKGDEVVAHIDWTEPGELFLTKILDDHITVTITTKFRKIARPGGDPIWIDVRNLKTPEQAVREGLCF